MYATNLTDQLFSAALPLKPLVAWCGSACSVTVAVPPAAALAGLNIGSVGVTLSLPDGSNAAAQAVHVANTPLWTATFPAANFATSGTVANGLMVTLAGEDENGVVRMWIVATGDLEVRPGDASPSPSGSWVAVKLRDGAPENPVEGDAYVSGGKLYLYDHGAWVQIGGGGVTVDDAMSETSENPVQNKVNTAALEGKQDALTAAQLAAANSGATAQKVAAWDGYAAQIAAKADASEVNAALAQKADADDLPYALVVPGEWTYSGVPAGVSNYGLVWDDAWFFVYYYEGESYGSSVLGDEDALELSFVLFDSTVTATRASLPGNLSDRAVNAVAVSTDTTLTLPAANPGHSRDLLVRLTVSATSAVTWTVAQGESWDAMGAPPSSFAAGTYLYRITEVAPGTWHCEDLLALVGLEAALADKMPMYPMVAVAPSSGTLTIAPYTVATYTAGSSAESFTVAVGAGTTGMARDCELVIDCTATGAVAPTVTWPSNFHPRTDAGTDFACEAGVRNVYYISEYATGQFAVGGWQETAGGNA